MKEETGCRWRDDDGICRCTENPHTPFRCPWTRPPMDVNALYPCPDWEAKE